MHSRCTDVVFCQSIMGCVTKQDSVHLIQRIGKNLKWGGQELKKLGLRFSTLSGALLSRSAQLQLEATSNGSGETAQIR